MSIEDIPNQPRRNYLLTPRLRVLMEQSPGGNPSAERRPDAEFFVLTDNRDALRWDLVRSQKKWPSVNDAQNYYLTTLAWSAMRRLEHTELKLEAFMEVCTQVEPVDENGKFKRMDLEDETDDAVPFQRDPAIG